MKVVRLPIWPGVSLTLMQQDGGWRFQSWERQLGHPMAPPPNADRAQWFPTMDAAAEFFRLICPRD